MFIFPFFGFLGHSFIALLCILLLNELNYINFNCIALKDNLLDLKNLFSSLTLLWSVRLHRVTHLYECLDVSNAKPQFLLVLTSHVT